MGKRFSIFFENLVAHYHNRADIYHIYYDGKEEPIHVKDISAFDVPSIINKNDLGLWLVTYLSQNHEIHYYEMYKAFMKDFANIWVNPSLEELDEMGSHQLQIFATSEKAMQNQLREMLITELVQDDYTVATGCEIINQLVKNYDAAVREISIVEWLEPTNIAYLKNNQSYIVDFDAYTKPIPIEYGMLYERLNQDFPISQKSLDLFFDHLTVTRRGRESRKIEEDQKIAFCYYRDMDHYLEENPCETKATTLRKLLLDAVKPREPFIEAIIADFGEIYVNHQSLRTEKDVLDFVNLAYQIEEIDREAKSFNRRKIFERLICKGLSTNTNLSFKRKNSIH